MSESSNSLIVSWLYGVLCGRRFATATLPTGCGAEVWVYSWRNSGRARNFENLVHAREVREANRDKAKEAADLARRQALLAGSGESAIVVAATLKK
jgi:hypothetical protein